MPNADNQSAISRARAKTEARPRAPDAAMIESEKARCAADEVYFINRYCQIFDNDAKAWIPFALWPVQIELLTLAHDPTISGLITLKTRQVGITWLLAIADTIYDMLFNPISETLMFSQREDDALALLSDLRLEGMYRRLPDWLKLSSTTKNKSEFRISNGSGARALPESAGGDSNTVTRLIVDEADLIIDLNKLLTRALPTLGKNGKAFVFSRVDKHRPGTYFKKQYAGAKKGELLDWKHFFIPADADPRFDRVQYDARVISEMAVKGTLDDLWEQHPLTDAEALAEPSNDKRFGPGVVNDFYQEWKPLVFPAGAPAILGLKVFKLPEISKTYASGADPAEGNPQSDDSAACWIDAETGEEVATLKGKFEPTIFADYVAQVCFYYNGAANLPERNNHGGTYITHMKQYHPEVSLRAYPSDNKAGWHTNLPSKTKLWDAAVKGLDDIRAVAYQEFGSLFRQNLPKLIHDFNTMAQVTSVDANTLKAPEGFPDDCAMAWALANMCASRGISSMMQVPYMGLYDAKGASRPFLSEEMRFYVATSGINAPLQLDPSGRPIQTGNQRNDDKPLTKGRW